MNPSAKEVSDTVLRFNPVAFDRNADDELGKSLGDKKLDPIYEESITGNNIRERMLLKVVVRNKG